MDINQTLPIYLQRNIVLILCRYINDCIKNRDLFNQEEYPEIKIKIKKLMVLLSMVNKEWFKTVSNNLNVIEFDDFERNIMEYNGHSSEYLILKIENCKYLKITPRDTIIVSTLAEKLTNDSFISLKSLLLQDSVATIKFLGELKDNKVSNVIYLDSLSLYPSEQIGESLINTLIESNVKKVYSVTIYQYDNELAIIKSFSTWSNSIKKIFYAGYRNYTYNVFQVLSSRVETGNINYLENIELIAINKNNGLSFDTTISVLKSSHKLKELYISLCFKTLIYILSTAEERVLSNISKCSNCLNYDNEQQVYLWSIICELFKTNNTLQHLTIHCTCNSIEVRCPKIVNEISNLVSSITSLDKFSLGSADYPEIFKSIVEKNKSITKFYTGIFPTIVDGKPSKSDQDQINNSISIFNDLIQSNTHITQFKFENCAPVCNPKSKNIINFNKIKN